MTRRDGREVEGTPLLREHTVKNCIEGSNPSLSAKFDTKPLFIKGFFISIEIDPQADPQTILDGWVDSL